MEIQKRVELTEAERIAINTAALEAGQTLLHENGKSRTYMTKIGPYLEFRFERLTEQFGLRGIRIANKWVSTGGVDFVDMDLSGIENYKPIEPITQEV